MQRRYFGTDGVRGTFAGPVMNERFAWRLGYAAGRWLAQANAPGDGALIGRDTRFSGPILERALAAGLAEAGVAVRSVGVLPTPAVSCAVRAFGASLGVVITASHNPAEDNGIKLFSAQGIKLPDTDEAAVERLLPPEDAAPPGLAGAAPLEVAPAETAYFDRLAGILPSGALRGWRLVVDAANGAAWRTTPTMLRNLGAEIDLIGAEPDGHNINRDCGSQSPGRMRRRVIEAQARLGIAHDGDADRLILADETGAEVDGDEILAVLAGAALRAGRLHERTLVATVQSNLGLRRFMEENGGRLVTTPVGDRYVIEAMRAGGFNLGGESSGHIICTEVALCGDGLAAALLVLRAMLETGAPLSELRRVLRKFPQATSALPVTARPELAAVPGAMDAIRRAEKRIGPDGRVMVRYSGTEPKLRLLVEGPDASVVAGALAELESDLRRALS